jgi:pSer/pThr/pTyr-binding forkhead associated (FHA) protein
MRVVLTLPDRLEGSESRRVTCTPADRREVALTPGERLLGRGSECDVVIDDRSVSRAHTAISISATSVVVRDLDSKNGTWVNGMRIASDRRLRHGDRLGLGMILLAVRLVGTDVEDDYDDGWLALQSALLVKASHARNQRDADEILFRVAEAFESRAAMSLPFGSDVTDAALAAVIDYAAARARPGWIRWATAIHAKLALAHGPAVRRAMENLPSDPSLRSSGTVPAALPSSRRRIA